MESLVRRLKYYGIGFAIGLIFVFFFFRNRGCSWLPENRVKNAILDRLVVVSDSTSEMFKKIGLTDDDIIQVLNDGDVVFDESLKDGDSKVYLLEKEGRKYCFTLPYESFLTEVFLSDKASEVATSTMGEGRILRFPLDSNLVFVDSSKVLGCIQDELGLINPRDILKELKKSGKIVFSKTNLEARPKPEHYLKFTRDTVTVGAKAIWYKNKIDINSFDLPGSDCYK